ncbi:MAG: hypothetical protein R3B07_17565 [Polyangiaceae bacterium]
MPDESSGGRGELAQRALRRLHPEDGELKGRVDSGEFPSRFRKTA